MTGTRVGYAGGATKNPNYNKIGDHSESLQIDFDPAVISYERLLEIFWQSHNGCEAFGSRQYRSVVFYHDEEQKKLALKTRDCEAVRRKQEVVTPILPVGTFYLAEKDRWAKVIRETGAKVD